MPEAVITPFLCILLLFDVQELDHDVHFWIGKHSTQDEYGTAAYKTVELDTYVSTCSIVILV